jgi:hypothetical protein
MALPAADCSAAEFRSLPDCGLGQGRDRPITPAEKARAAAGRLSATDEEVEGGEEALAARGETRQGQPYGPAAASRRSLSCGLILGAPFSVVLV